MEKRCYNCMYSGSGCSDIIGTCRLHDKWKQARDIRRGKITKVIVDFTDYKVGPIHGKGIVLYNSEDDYYFYEGEISETWKMNGFDRLPYSEYKQYLNE